VRVLVTNDDGIDSQGLHVLAGALLPLADVVVVAPDTEYSGAGAALGPLQQIRPEIHRRTLDGIEETWAVSGPPALCVYYARLGVFGPPFDLIVAGINPGANVGRSVYHSGTVGAALTARLGGVSGLAVSQAVKGFGIEGQGWDEMLEGQRWETAAEVARVVMASMLAEPPSEPVVVNLNVPNLPLGELHGWRSTRLGPVPPRSAASATLEPKIGYPGSYRVRMQWGAPATLPEDTDGGAVERGFVSLTLLDAIHEADPATTPQIDAALDTLLGN
jgi:5'-nucleotidase